jgi:ACR3 family arsenite efflux pump ArsB
MMYPILCKVRYETLHRTFRAKKLWIQVAFSVVVNWILAPFFMVIHPQKHLVAVFFDNKYSWLYRGHFSPMKKD